MYFNVSSIECLRREFSVDYTLTKREQVSFLARAFLVSELKKQGFSFDFNIETTPKGKPYFVNKRDMFFSLSHTADFVAVAFSLRSIGIDIEHSRKGMEAVVNRFFHSGEREYVFSQAELITAASDEGDMTSTQIFDRIATQLWTVKEAYVKMTGTGIANNFSSVDLSPENFNPNQNYVKENARIISYYDKEKDLFVSLAISLV
ncbi:MAG: 4'-phosphopantetheinyl transferase superfamily protein [Bacteroidales bacterium]|nr:4'-phosphopantetheinyl transferase superfamily protein [Bacteroidales bacterium]